MKKVLVFLFTAGLLISCDNSYDCPARTQQTTNEDYLIFGYYGIPFCGEESFDCTNIYKLTNEELYEDINKNDDPFLFDFEFVALENEKFEQIKDLSDFFPDQLLNETEQSIGSCFNCSDSPLLFVQYSENGNVRSWTLDLTKEDVPEYLHDFIDKIQEKMMQLRQ